MTDHDSLRAVVGPETRRTPPVTLAAALVAAVAEIGPIPKSRAVRHIESPPRSGKPRMGFDDVAADVAIAHVLTKMLGNMRQRKAVERDDVGGYRVLRPLRLIGQAAELAASTTMDDVRSSSALVNLRIVARQYRAQIQAATEVHTRRVPLPVARALLTWLDADAKAYAEQQAEQA